MDISRLSDVGGIEIRGVDLSNPRDDAESHELRRLFDLHGLVVFRGQRLTKQQLVDAGKPFGGAVTDIPGAVRDPEVPGIVIVSTRGATGDVMPEDKDAIVGDIDWHTDQGYVTAPNRGKILYVLQIPSEGGLTGFIDGKMAYDRLAEDMKRRIDGLHVIHSFRHAERYVARNRAYHRDGGDALAPGKFPDIAFPVVCTNPATGAKSLNVPPLWAAGIVEMPGEDGGALLAELQAHLVQPSFQYWHRYDVGDAVLWDNWRFVHAAGGTPGRYARTLWSISLQGGAELGRPLAMAG